MKVIFLLYTIDFILLKDKSVHIYINKIFVIHIFCAVFKFRKYNIFINLYMYVYI